MPIVGVDEEDFPTSKFVIGFLLAWLIPRVYIDWNRTLLVVKRHYSESGASEDVLGSFIGKVNLHAVLAISCWGSILVVSNVLVAYFTEGLDPRMVLILAGLARIVCAGILFIMSLELPQWLGVYDYLKIIVDQKEDNDSLSTSLTTTNTTDPPVFSMKVTLFELHWTIMGQYIRIFLSRSCLVVDLTRFGGCRLPISLGFSLACL